MATFATALQILAGIIPTIMALVKAFEMPGNGEAKKEGVITAVQKILEGYNTMSGSSVPVTMVLTLASGLIDGIVHFYNIVGLFTKKEG
jgi:ABC-type transporter Mla maintaining outer membrane lipid asymmetry permease subunit MlaE